MVVLPPPGGASTPVLGHRRVGADDRQALFEQPRIGPCPLQVRPVPGKGDEEGFLRPRRLRAPLDSAWEIRVKKFVDGAGRENAVRRGVIPGPCSCGAIPVHKHDRPAIPAHLGNFRVPQKEWVSPSPGRTDQFADPAVVGRRRLPGGSCFVRVRPGKARGPVIPPVWEGVLGA